MKNFIFTFGLITIFLLFLDIKLTYSQNNKFDSLADEINRISNLQKTKALQLLDSLYVMVYKSSDSSLLLARCIFEEAVLKSRHKIIDTILENRISSKLVTEKLLPDESALLKSAYGAYLSTIGDYSKAFEIQLQTLEEYELLSNKRFIAKTLNDLGNICYKIGLYNLADYYFIEAITYITPDIYDYHRYKLNIITTKIGLKEYGIDSLLHLLEYAENEKLDDILPFIYNNLSSDLGDINPEKSFYYLNKVKNIDNENQVLKSMIIICFAKDYE